MSSRLFAVTFAVLALATLGACEQKQEPPAPKKSEADDAAKKAATAPAPPAAAPAPEPAPQPNPEQQQKFQAMREEMRKQLIEKMASAAAQRLESAVKRIW